MDDVPDLFQLIVDSVPRVKHWNELSDLGVAERRRIVFLFDSFNEMPEHLQRNGAVVLQRFVEKQKDRHVCLIGSRLIPYLEQLARPPSPFKTFEILRLASDQVRGFLQDLGLGSLYERMSRELRDLAGNPFMLLAIARTLAGKPERTLPRKRGKLYQSFAREWMERERKKQRSLRYSYERVKEPLLAYLAKRMTSAGQTWLAWTNDVEQGVESQLEQIHKRIKRRGRMPDDWTVDRCLDEIFRDGLLKQLNEQLHFMHQSVQEYFTGLYFCARPDALVDFTPKLMWDLVATYDLAEVPNHRFVPPLLMMVGLLNDSTEIVEALAVRNPILAAATISSANRVDGALLSKLEQSWLDLLKHDELRYRMVACSCLAHAQMTSRQVIRDLVTMALAPDYQSSHAGLLALEKLDAPEVIANELVEQVVSLLDDEYEKNERKIGGFVKELQTPRMVDTLFEQWRTFPPDSSTRRRFERLLGTVDRSLLTEELQRIRIGAYDPAIAADAERALTEAASWESVSGLISARRARQLWAQAQKKYTDQLTETVTRMRSMDSAELAVCFRSTDPAVRAAAAKLAAERQVPVGDVILESLVRFDQGWSRGELIAALTSLWGEHTAVSKLVERSRERCYCVGALPPELAAELTVGALAESVKTQIEELGVRSDNFTVDRSESDGSTSSWILSPSSWSSYRPRYQLRVSPGRLELYDCNVTLRAFDALAEIPGEASFTELQRAVQHDDPDVQIIAINALAERGDQSLAARLIAQLRSTTSDVFIDAALDALGKLQTREALSLLNDLLATTDAEWSDVHPVWGPCPHSLGWGHAIHGTLVRLNADSDIQQALDKAVASEDPIPKVAALKEFSRWFAEPNLGPERDATWRTPERLQRLLGLALRDSIQSVRTAAAEVLGKLKSEFVQESLMGALAGNSVEVQLAAGDALLRIEAREMYGQVAEAMLPIAKANHAQDLRRRAGKVLSAIPGGVEPFYQPIQEALGHGDSGRALEMIEATLETIPEDANLFWWRGHALRSLGRLDRAADTYQRAFELEKQASVIPQALAQTFLELGDCSRAMEAARRGAEIAPGDADAQAVLAWSSYKAGAIPETVEAASKAVDLDPVHGDAIWIVLLGHIRQANVEESHSAFRHALTVRQLLSPRLDTSFVTTFLNELEAINTANAEISRLMEEIKETLG